MSEVRVTISDPKTGELLEDIIISSRDHDHEYKLSTAVRNVLELSSKFDGVTDNDY